MSGPTPPVERDPGAAPPPGRVLLAIMATVLAFALIVFVDGVLSLILDRDVIEEPDAGPLVGVSMVLVALAVVLAATLRRRAGSLAGAVASTALAVTVLSPLVGAIAYSFVRAELGVIPVFFGEYVLNPFVLATAVVCALVVLAHRIIRSPEDRSGGPSVG